MKKENYTLTQAIWMLSSAIQNISDAIKAHENDFNTTIEWLTLAVDNMAKAEEAIKKTKILPF